MTEEDWDKLSDDKKWEWILQNKNTGIKILLDNDATYVTHDDWEHWLQFDWYIGNSAGVHILLDCLNINSDGV